MQEEQGGARKPHRIGRAVWGGPATAVFDCDEQHESLLAEPFSQIPLFFYLKKEKEDFVVKILLSRDY